MYYSYVEIEYVATSFSPARMDLVVKLVNVKARKHQLHVTFCKLLRELATMYIVQCWITGYPEDVAFADLIAAKTNTTLNPINMDSKKFLKT